MRITYAVRADARRKHGGDVGKVAHYRHHLDPGAFPATLACSLRELEASRPDLVHLLNIDLPLENLAYARWCRRAGVPYVVSTIHHPLAGLRAYYDGDRYDRLNRVLRRAGVGFARGWLLRERIKLGAQRRLRGAAAVPWRSLRAAQQEVLAGAAAILPQTPGERRTVTDEIAVLPTRLVPNGITFLNGGLGPTARRVGVLSVGRVEPRKNQVGLLRALRGSGVPVTVVGQRNPTHPDYLADFDREIAANPLATYHPHVDQADLVGFYQRARVHVSLSWYEVASQVDVEAVALGCHPVVTRHSYIGDYVEGPVSVYDPARHAASPAALRDLVLGAHEQPAQAVVRHDVALPWAEVTARLTDVYREVAA